MRNQIASSQNVFFFPNCAFHVLFHKHNITLTYIDNQTILAARLSQEQSVADSWEVGTLGIGRLERQMVILFREILNDSHI